MISVGKHFGIIHHIFRLASLNSLADDSFFRRPFFAISVRYFLNYDVCDEIDRHDVVNEKAAALE
jgi:hypothetical protein